MIPPGHNSEFLAAMEQVLEVYKRPYYPMRPVVCMDGWMDESPKQLIAETREVCSIFIANEPLAGTCMVQVLPTRTKVQWAHFLIQIAERWPEAERITLAIDNLSAHTPGTLYERFRPIRQKNCGTGSNLCILPSTGAG